MVLKAYLQSVGYDICIQTQSIRNSTKKLTAENNKDSIIDFKIEKMAGIKLTNNLD